jgi:hypothetical protein
VTIVILLVLVAVLWVVALAPSVLRRVGEYRGVGSIDHFHHQLQLLEHAGPKTVTPAYRLHTAQPGRSSAAPAPETHAMHRAKLVLLRPVDDEGSADIDGNDGAHYERVGILDPPESPLSAGPSRAELASYRRHQARQRCTTALRLLIALAVGTALLGLLPSFRLAWILTGLTGILALALVALIGYAREMEAQSSRRRPRYEAPPVEEYAVNASYQDPATAGFPGAWDDDQEDEPPHQVAAAH